MRLLKIGVYYSVYLQQFYARTANLAQQPYSVQHAALIDDCFGSSDFWTNALTGLGYETCDIVANSQPMQVMWAREHGLEFDRLNWLFDILTAQIKLFRPDVLLVADYSTVTGEFLRHLRDTCPSIRLVMGWCGAPFYDASIFSECDVVLSCVPELVARFRDNGHRSRHVNHAFDPRVLQKIDVTSTPAVDFAFPGSIVKADQFHLDREKLLARLVAETDLQIWSDAGRVCTEAPATAGFENGQPAVSRRRAFPNIALSALLPMVHNATRRVWRKPEPSSLLDPRIIRRSQPPLFGLRMFQQLHDSRVALNTHIDISPINASNMRLFEATGVGACLLTDWKVNLPELFEPDSEVVAYRDADECVEKVTYLLQHEEERRRIAEAGQRRTLRDHTFAARAAEIDSIIHETLTFRC